MLADRTLLNIDLDWDFADYQQAFKVTTNSVVKLVVSQNCWLADVAGRGYAGRSAVRKTTVMAQEQNGPCYRPALPPITSNLT